MYHTNCDDAQTDQGFVWSYFPQINIPGKPNQSQKNVKRGMYRMRMLNLVFAIRRCYKCHFFCTCTAQLDPDHTACVTKFTLQIPHGPNIVSVNGGDCP